MTVISAWWRLNLPFQRLSGRLNYYITRCGQEVRELGDQRSWRKGVVVKASRKLRPRAFGWASGERERHNTDGHKSGGEYIAVPFGLQLPHTRNLTNKMRGTYFSKRLCRSLLLCVVMILHVYACEYTTLPSFWSVLIYGWYNTDFIVIMVRWFQI